MKPAPSTDVRVISTPRVQFHGGPQPSSERTPHRVSPVPTPRTNMLAQLHGRGGGGGLGALLAPRVGERPSRAQDSHVAAAARSSGQLHMSAHPHKPSRKWDADPATAPASLPACRPEPFSGCAPPASAQPPTSPTICPPAREACIQPGLSARNACIPTGLPARQRRASKAPTRFARGQSPQPPRSA
jgi:hypothetical protein